MDDEEVVVRKWTDRSKPRKKDVSGINPLFIVKDEAPVYFCENPECPELGLCGGKCLESF